MDIHKEKKKKLLYEAGIEVAVEETERQFNNVKDFFSSFNFFSL